jgi:hypothetical protein
MTCIYEDQVIGSKYKLDPRASYGSIPLRAHPQHHADYFWYLTNTIYESEGIGRMRRANRWRSREQLKNLKCTWKPPFGIKKTCLEDSSLGYLVQEHSRGNVRDTEKLIITCRAALICCQVYISRWICPVKVVFKQWRNVTPRLLGISVCRAWLARP